MDREVGEILGEVEEIKNIIKIYCVKKLNEYFWFRKFTIKCFPLQYLFLDYKDFLVDKSMSSVCSRISIWTHCTYVISLSDVRGRDRLGKCCQASLGPNSQLPVEYWTLSQDNKLRIDWGTISGSFFHYHMGKDTPHSCVCTKHTQHRHPHYQK